MCSAPGPWQDSHCTLANCGVALTLTNPRSRKPREWQPTQLPSNILCFSSSAANACEWRELFQTSYSALWHWAQDSESVNGVFSGFPAITAASSSANLV